MAVITMPDTLYMSSMSWRQKRNEMVTRSIFGAQTVEVAAPLWMVDIAIDRLPDSKAGPWKSLIMQLEGQVNQFAVWDKMRPVPLGTMRGTMVLDSNAAQGATQLVIDAGAGEAGETLVEGDMLGLGTGTTQQVVMVTGDATADVNGVITVNIQPPLRNAFTAGDSVTWDKPKALFRRTNAESGWDYSGTYASGFNLSLIEDWRP